MGNLMGNLQRRRGIHQMSVRNISVLPMVVKSKAFGETPMRLH
jgi:hypothetical protein